MKFLLMITIFIVTLFSTDVYDCNKVFDERKNELLDELEKIDEQQQSLESLQAATSAMLKNKEKRLLEKEQELNTKMKNVTQILKDIKEEHKKNKQVLSTIQKGIDTKIIKAYSKMGSGKAALILAQMQIHEACKIMFDLQPKQVGSILEKIPPAKAAKITVMLQGGPPFLDFVNNHDVDKSKSIDTVEEGF